MLNKTWHWQAVSISDFDSYTSARKSHLQNVQPGIERVQALADILRSTLRHHSNETRAPMANPLNSAQLDGTSTIPPNYIRVRALVWECGKGQTDTQTAVTNIHFTLAMPHVKCNYVSLGS